MAKLIIKLINAVAETVNRDPRTNRRLKVVFVPDMNVKTGQRLYPAADLSEQISTAGKEASGTGNMKFSMNGALTIGTLDGANVEIREAVGDDNFFLFGHTVDGVQRLWTEGYRPRDVVLATPELKSALEAIGSGLFSHGDTRLFEPFLDNLWNQDPFLVCADFSDYLEKQERAAQQYAQPDVWTRMSIFNVSRMGHFSSDRAIGEYSRYIWNVHPVALSRL
jgi:starch phosphorylase